MISVVVSSYDNEACLDSLAAQTVGDIEVIVVGDGSRNRGLEAASGEFLAFADGGDTLAANAYELMLHTLNETGSDFVSALDDRLAATHISQTPELLYDVSVGNKLFRRSFWDLHRLRYPEGMACADIQLMIQAHVLARQVDVIPDAVCHRRERPPDASLRDLMTALAAIDTFLGSYGPARLLRAHQLKALQNDLWRYVRDMHNASQEYRAEFAVLAGDYLRTVGPRVLRSLPATHKLAYQLVREEAMPELAEFAAWLAAQPVTQVPLVRRGFRYEADLPFWRKKGLNLPRRIYRPHWQDLDPYMRVDDVAWDGDSLVVTGRANVPSIDVARRRDTSKIVMLCQRGRLRRRGGGGRLPVLVRARSFLNPAATALSEQERYNYDWSGFRFAVPAGTFDHPGTWQVWMLVRGRSVWRAVRVHTPVPGAAERPSPREIAPGLRSGARWDGLGLSFVTWRVAATLASYAWTGSGVVLEISAPGVTDRTARLVLGGRTVLAERNAAGWFRAEVPVGALRGEVYLAAGDGERERVAWPDGMPEGRWVSDGLEVVVGRSRYGDLVLTEGNPRPVIDSHSWLAGGRLELRGSFLGADGSHRTLLKRTGSGDTHVVPFELAGERFRMEPDLERMPFFGERVPLADGEWTFAELTYDHDAVGSVPASWVEAGRKRYRFMVTGHDDPLIVAEPRLRRSEQGNYAQRALRRGYYPVASRAPLRDSVLFVSWNGAQCGDNPLGIAAELARRGDDREQLWVVNDWSVPVPAGGTGVLRGTHEYVDALARSRWIVSNDGMQPPFRKRDGQFYLQTWHGTMPGRLPRDVAQWDLLLSPNPSSTPLLRRAFRYEGEIAEYGYPRNDVLVRPDVAAVAASVRRRLGIPDGKRVVLYASAGRDRLDLAQAYRAVGDDHVILVRGSAGGMRPGFAIDVTAYPDVAELYLVSDVLVTGCSSAAFDYALTGRPMLFFTHDLEGEPPGPLLTTSEDVIAALADVHTAVAPFADAYKHFTDTYCSLDDGHAGARVCDRLFGAYPPDLKIL